MRVLVEGRLGAVVSPVEPMHFGEEALQRNLEDLSWLAETARAHHNVVDVIGQHHAVAPLRMATVYLDDDNVRALLHAKEAAFMAALDRIRGRKEWGVKAFARSRAGAGVLIRAALTVNLGPGAAYLLRKRMAGDRVARARQDVQDVAADLHQTLSAAAGGEPPLRATGPAALWA